MPKKDTNAAVLGMLSSAGERTRPAAEPAPAQPAPPIAEALQPPVAEEPAQQAPATVSALTPASRSAAAVEKAPRTLRLQSHTASALRDAWLTAKRDDVLLTFQDFASALIDEALVDRRLQRSAVAR